MAFCFCAWSFDIQASAGEAEKPAGPAGAGKPRLILRSVEATGLEEEDARMVEHLLCAELGKNKAFDVGCPDDVNALLKDQALKQQLGACAGLACGGGDRVLKNDYLVSPSLRVIDERYSLTLTIAPQDSEDVAAKAQVGTKADMQYLAEKIPSVVKDLYADFKKPKPPKPAPAKEPEKKPEQKPEQKK
jgi:hypothetical protein